MRRKRRSMHPFRVNEAFLFLLTFAALIVSLFISSNGSAEIALLHFAAPAVQKSLEAQNNSKIHVQLVPKGDLDSEDTQEPQGISLTAVRGDNPSILIYHTHTLEAYTPTDKYPYTERGGKWRTNDNTRNIVTVGEALADALRSYGFNVIHDTTNHEPPKLATAYERSLKTMESYKKKYPGLVMYIDLHRDACGKGGKNDYCVIDGEKTAKVMFVVGTGKGATGTGFAQMPDFDSNYAYAEAICNYLKSVNPKLVREIRVKPGRYNQHVSDCCMLIEIGHNMNTLEEALAATKHVAAGIAELTKVQTASN